MKSSASITNTGALHPSSFVLTRKTNGSFHPKLLFSFLKIICRGKRGEVGAGKEREGPTSVFFLTKVFPSNSD